MKMDNHKMDAQPEPYLTAPEVAHLCNVSVRSVYRWADVGLVPVYRAGSKARFKREDIDAYLARDTKREAALAR